MSIRYNIKDGRYILYLDPHMKHVIIGKIKNTTMHDNQAYDYQLDVYYSINMRLPKNKIIITSIFTQSAEVFYGKKCRNLIESIFVNLEACIK